MDITYNKITRTVRAQVEDKAYSFRLSLNGLQELEAVGFGGKSYFDYQKAHESLPVETMIEAFRIMLRSAGDSEAAKNPMQVADTLCADAGLPGLESVFYATLAASGIMGPKTSAQMLQQLGLEDKDPEPEASPEEDSDAEGEQEKN